MVRVELTREHDGVRCDACDRVIVRSRYSPCRDGDRCDRDRYGDRMRRDGKSGDHYRFLIGARTAWRYRDGFDGELVAYRCEGCVEECETTR